VHGVNGLWGVLSVGIFATGEYGAGWNGVVRDGFVKAYGSDGVRGLLASQGAACMSSVRGHPLPRVVVVTTVKMGNVLFENLGGGKFRNVSKESGLDYVGHSSGATFFDFDNDGLLDVFVANVGIYTTDKKGRGGYYIGVAGGAMKFTTPERQEASILYKNLGGLKFKEVSKEMNLQHVGTCGDAGFGDVNEDGFPDLYVLNMEGPNKFYENQKGKGFVEKAQSYFPRTPSGAMFEATVSKPQGFLVDERFEELGKSFQVPPVFADRAKEIMDFLEPLKY